MTADRNTTADALTEVADYHVTECVDMHGDQGEDGPGPDCCFHARAAYTVGDAARLLRTPDTPTDSDTAARARALLDAYPEDVFESPPQDWKAGMVTGTVPDAVDEDGYLDVWITPDAFAAHVLRKIALPVIATLLERAVTAEADRDEAERRERTAVNLANYHRGVAREAGRRADAARPPAPTESTPDPPYQPVAGRPTMDLLDRGTDR